MCHRMATRVIRCSLVALKILDRYLVRAIVPPMLVALVGLTFVLMMPPILQNAERLIAKGVPWTIIMRVMLTLVPQALGLTIPMALLYGILLGLGRLSADREFVALQACGVSVFRVFRPIALVAVLACAATAYNMIVALPDANQRFREITYNIVASGAETDIKARVFFTSFPNRVLYIRDIQPDGLARRLSRRRDGAGAHHRVHRQSRPDGHRPREADARARARERHAAHDLARSPRGLRRRSVRSHRPQGRPRNDFSADADREGGQRKDHR